MGGEGQGSLWTVAAGVPSEHRSPAPARVHPRPWTRQKGSVRGPGKQFQSSTLCTQVRPPGLRRLPGREICVRDSLIPLKCVTDRCNRHPLPFCTQITQT